MIRWFARNDVAANFLMLAVLFLGLRAAFTEIPLEIRPAYEFREIDIRMSYRGGTPEDVERSIVLPIEQALEGLPGVKEIRSEANSGSAEIEVEPDRDADIDKMLEEVQRRIEVISTFPSETERPRIRIPSTDSWWEVCTVMVYGDLSESDLLKVSYQVRDDLLSVPGISQVSLTGNREREISIETNPDILQSYGLSIADLTNAVRQSSIDLPAGSIRTAGGRLLLRTKSQAYEGEDFSQLMVRAADGVELRLGDVATVSDGFGEDKGMMRYNRQRCMRIEVLRSGNESAIEISNAVRKYIENASAKYPDGVNFALWDDESISMRSRLSILGSSLALGAVLVFIVLGLFLRPMLAFFVMIGIPVSFAGGLMMMPTEFPFLPWGAMTLNLMSVFGFIIVVGIVVDDAIVTGENIYTKLRSGMDPLEAAVIGTKEVATPVTFGVLTTIVAFIPLMFYDGFWGNFARQIPPVVAFVLLFSLVQSKLILPSHLKHLKTGRTKLGLFARFQKRIADSLELFVDRMYKPFLHFVARHRYATLAVFSAMGLAALGYSAGGHIKFEMMPTIDRYQIYCSIYMPDDTPFEKTDEIVQRVYNAAEQLGEEFRDPETGESLVTGIMNGAGVSYRGRADESYGMVSIELLPPSMRSEPGPNNALLEARLRELVGPLDEADYFRVRSQDGYRGDDTDAIEIELRGPDSEGKRAVAKEIEELMQGFEGIHKAGSDMGGRRDELEIQLKPRARELGLTEVQLARQIRYSFFGDEAQRIQRDREEIRVMIRLPENLRENLHTLQNMQVRTASGDLVPFDHVATATVSKAPTDIDRKNGARVHYVRASPEDKKADIIGIAERAQPEIDAIVAQEPGLSWRYTGDIEEYYRTNAQTKWNWLFLIIALYALLAIPFRGLLQPVFVLLAIPFGLIGALLGHVIMDLPISHLSRFGMMALAGVVVNDSLVMVDFTNRRKHAGMSPREAVLIAGPARFRPIILTSLTTFAGLLPLMLDKSIQAQFLIPMAVSLAFGILFSTAVTLLLIPCAYLANEDLKRGVRKLWNWSSHPFQRGEEVASSSSAPPPASAGAPPLAK